MSDAQDLTLQISTALPFLKQGVEVLEEAVDKSMAIPYIDRTDEMPLNLHPSHKDFVRCFPDRDMWPLRELHEITGLTIHHTMSHSPLATARFCTIGKGYPTIQYHYWVSADDGCPCYMLVEPSVQLWHDHTGTWPSSLSVGLAGRWDYQVPPGEQLQSLARLVKWLVNEYAIPVSEIKGHNDRAWAVSKVKTDCPGWDKANWRDAFFGILAPMLRS